MRKRTLILLLAGILLCGFVITPLSDASDTKYYGSKKSNKYHKAICRYVEKIKDENLVTFNSAKEARDAGYVPCKVCKPPKKDNQEIPQTNYPSSETLKCTSVVDGDTTKILRNTETVSVRLIGVNAPEKSQKGWREARDFVWDLCLDKDVRIEFDLERTDNE